MKGIRKYRKNLQKITISLVLLSLLMPVFAVLFEINISATSTTSSNEFVGYSGSADIETATNTQKNSDGTYTNPVSDLAPQITFLIPGLGGNASHWSNNYQIGITNHNGQTLAYNDKSLLEKLFNLTNANIYYADITTTYEKKVIENGFTAGLTR